jgi:hypothetical protein
MSSSNVPETTDKAEEDPTPPSDSNKKTDKKSTPDVTNKEEVQEKNPTAKPKDNLATSSTQVMKVAAELLYNRTVNNLTDNVAPDSKMIRLKPLPLLALFTNTLKPLIYANARNVGVNDLVQPANRIRLNDITYTVAVCAIGALRAVIYAKAMRVNNAVLRLFGDRPRHEKYTFPALTTLLINACGPINRSFESYRCLFIPYITKEDLETIKKDERYVPSYLELFSLALSRAHYSIRSSGVDIYNDISSYWWTLHVVVLEEHDDTISVAETQSKGKTLSSQSRVNKIVDRVNVYSPMSFKDIDDSVVFSAICMDETLYDFPGPCYTSKIGPFAAHTKPKTVADVPRPYNRDIYINKSVPVRLTNFIEVKDINGPEAAVFGAFQNDTKLSDETPSELVNPHRAISDFKNRIEAALYNATNPTEPGQIVASKSSPKVAYVEPQPLTFGSVVDPIPMTAYKLYEGFNYYFDHQILMNYSKESTQHLVEEANKPLKND